MGSHITATEGQSWAPLLSCDCSKDPVPARGTAAEQRLCHLPALIRQAGCGENRGPGEASLSDTG